MPHKLEHHQAANDERLGGREKVQHRERETEEYNGKRLSTVTRQDEDIEAVRVEVG